MNFLTIKTRKLRFLAIQPRLDPRYNLTIKENRSGRVASEEKSKKHTINSLSRIINKEVFLMNEKKRNTLINLYFSGIVVALVAVLTACTVLFC